MICRILLIAVLTIAGGCSAPRGIYHHVGPGQTLFTIARTYQVDAKELARVNGISDPARLRAGQRLLIPGAEKERKVPATAGLSTATGNKTSTSPTAGDGKAPGLMPAPSARGAASRVGGGEKRPVAVDKKPAGRKGEFIWPLRGKVVRNFGRQGNQTCQGLEIAASAGTPVVSAAAGRVTYSGRGIRGYGHLIILRHDGEFFTVYGFNQQSLVAAGDWVKQGQRIALSGVPPGGGSPRLHFEIRKGKSPVDPIFYLP
jgi:lipoprotein NlpD